MFIPPPTTSSSVDDFNQSPKHTQNFVAGNLPIAPPVEAYYLREPESAPKLSFSAAIRRAKTSACLPKLPVLDLPVPAMNLPPFSRFVESFSNKVETIDMASLQEGFGYVMNSFSEEGTAFSLSLVSLFYRMYKLQTFGDLFFAAVDFLKSVFSTSQIMAAASTVYKLVTACMSDLYNKILTSPRTTESSVLDVLKGIKNNMSLVLNSEIVSSIRDFVLSLVTFKVFSKDSSKQITTTLGPAKPCSGLELIEVCLKSAISVLSFSESVAEGVPLDEIFCSKDPVSSFVSTVAEIDSTQTLTYSGLPVEGRVCRREYLMRVVSTVKAGETLKDSLPRNAPQMKVIESNLRIVRSIKADFMNRMSAENRPVPFCICLHSLPGVGKSKLIDVLAKLWSRVKAREFTSGQMYHRQATEEYWSGYEPFSQPILHYSEPGSINRNLAKTSGDVIMSEFLSVSDNLPYACNMADLESKGKVMALPELVLMDCNDANMNLDVLLSNPAAARRRLLYIEPSVKPSFRKPGTTRMDQAVSLASDTPKLDRWTFNVYSMEPKNNVDSNTIVHLKECDIYELSDFLTGMFEDHIEKQIAIVNMEYSVDEYVGTGFSKTAEKPKTESLVYVSNSALRTRFLPPAWEITCAFTCAMGWYFALIFLYIFSLFLWFWPQNFVYKAISIRVAYQRIAFVGDRADVAWNYFRASIGLQNKYTCRVQPSYHTQKFVLALGGVLIALKLYNFASVFTEGNLVSSSASHTEEHIDEKIAEIEEKSAAQRPPPRVKRGNGIDWDTLPRSIPVPIDHPQQLNEPLKVNQSVVSNVRLVHIDGAKTIETHVTGICSDFAVVNRHSISHPKADGSWTFTVKMSESHQVGIFQCNIRPSEFLQIEGDLYLVRLRGAKFKDIRPYLCSDYVTPAPYGNKAYIGSDKVVVHTTSPITAQDANWGEVVVKKALGYNWPEHASGKCGLPLVVQYSGGSGVCGFHVAGSTGNLSYAQSVRGPDILRAIQSLETATCALPVNSEGKLRLPSKITGVGPISERSPLNFEHIPGLNVYGGLIGLSTLKLGKSKLLSSPFVHDAERLTGCSPFDAEGAPLFGAPPFSAGVNKITGEYQGPYNHFVKKAGILKKSLDPEILTQTIELITEHLVSSLRAKGVTSIRPTTLEIAQNGDPKDFYMRAMKPSTSGGFTFPGAKKKFSRECCLDFKSDAYMPLFDVKEQLYEQCSAYERGEDALPLLGAQLKDEPRSLQKIRDRKTRVFCMSPYESTLVNRMYLMPFYTLMVEHGDIFRTAIGVNMHSTDVSDIQASMAAYSTFMEGDYGGFDTSMPYDIGLAANTIVSSVCESLGYDSYALNQVRGILSDNLYPTVVMRGDVFAAPALQPSGKYATAEDNSLRGLVLLVYYWVTECQTHDLQPVDFWTSVLPLIYGDDVIVGVEPPARAFFNNNKYQEFCTCVYGLEYTSALKTSEMEDFLTWDQCSFLKRNFVFRADLDQWVAPLDKASIMKSIVYYLPSKSVSKEDQLIDSCVSALRELFFHLSEPEYHIRRLLFAEVVGRVFERNSSDILKVFPSFEEIRTQLYGSNAQLLTCESKTIDQNLIDEFLKSTYVPSKSNLMDDCLKSAYVSTTKRRQEALIEQARIEKTWQNAILTVIDPRLVRDEFHVAFYGPSFMLRLIVTVMVTFVIASCVGGLVIAPRFYAHLFGFAEPTQPWGPIEGTIYLSVIAAPLAEEWCKDGDFGLHASFAVSEILNYGVSLERIPAFFMHFYLANEGPKSYWRRVAFHMLFNACATLHFVYFPPLILNSDAATQHSNMTDFCPV